ncbi:MAG: hydrolase [Herbinix sp.]|jgi:8-oxo-dGTP pyrophosphatase MutT (NUDIX family)|nr:hydrolase [Herbinix sp.]
MERYRILVKGIIQYEDKYLVVRRWFDDRMVEPYQWGFIDGAIDFGEAPDKAVLRCINEQTGLSATIERILYTWTFTTGEIFNIGISYHCKVTFDQVVLSEELTDASWITKEELETYIDRRVLNDVESAEL